MTHVQLKIFEQVAMRTEAEGENMLTGWPDALHEVLVGVPVPGQHLPQGRNNMEGVEVVQALQLSWSHLAELYKEREEGR